MALRIPAAPFVGGPITLLTESSAQTNISGPDATTNVEIGSTANDANAGTGGTSVVIGNGATNVNNATGAIFIGSLAQSGSASSDSIAIGRFANAAGGIALGPAAVSANGSVAIGASATTAGGNMLVSGSSTNPMTNVYFGKGVTNTTATAYTINGTGGSGANNAGGSLILAGGKSTGSAVPATVQIQTGTAAGSSSTAQTLTTRLTVSDAAATFTVPLVLPAGAVGAGALADNTVTYAKMQDVSAASRLVGRGSAAGAGDPQELTLGTGLTMTGTVLSASGGGGGADTWQERVAFPAAANADDDEFRAALSGWTQVDRATNAVTWVQDGDLVSVKTPGALGAETIELHALLKPITGFAIGNSVTVALRAMGINGGNFHCGVILSDGATYGAGSQVEVAWSLTAQFGTTLTRLEWTGFNAVASGANSTVHLSTGPYLWLRLTWQAANTFRYEVSMDGVSWLSPFADIAYTLTPTHAGLVVSSYNGAGGSNIPAAASFELFRVQ